MNNLTTQSSDSTNSSASVGIAAQLGTSEPNGAASYLRLRDRVGACMQSKGYRSVGDLQYLGGCDARCLYP
jgi:hypothetical protein